MVQHIRAITLVLLGNFLFSSCGDSGQHASGSAGQDAGTEEAVAATRAPAFRSLRAGDQMIPVYEDFAGIQPIFEKKNDTTYVINFWATWCKPCIEELPYFEDLHGQFEGEKLRIILVSLDFERDLETKLVDFIAKRQLRSDVMVLLDGNYNEWIDRVDPGWGGAIPVTVVYNAEKREFVGQQLANAGELRDLVHRMLN